MESQWEERGRREEVSALEDHRASCQERVRRRLAVSAVRVLGAVLLVQLIQMSPAAVEAAPNH
jgi:hypothetical protein